VEGLVALSRHVATTVDRQRGLRDFAETLLGVMVKPVHANACGTVCTPTSPCPTNCTCGSGNDFVCVNCTGSHYCDCYSNCLRQCFGC
jgi:hypothetical protein